MVILQQRPQEQRPQEANPYEEIHEVDEETGEIFVSIKLKPRSSPSPSSHAAMAYELDGEDAVDFAGMMNALGVEVDEAAADAEAWPAEAADDESLERAALARSSSAEHKRADAEFAAALSASEVYEEEARSSRRRAAESADEAYARAIFASLAAAERDDVEQDAVVAKALACEDEDDAERGGRRRGRPLRRRGPRLRVGPPGGGGRGRRRLRAAPRGRGARPSAAAGRGRERRRRARRLAEEELGGGDASLARRLAEEENAGARAAARAVEEAAAARATPPRAAGALRRADERAALDDAAIRAALRPHRGRPAADAADEAFARSLAAAEDAEPAPAVDPSLNRRERRAMDKRPWAVPEAELETQESASQQIKAQRGRPRCRGVDTEETLAKAAEAARLASDATRAAMAEAFDRAHSLGARGDPAYRQAKALRDRMYRQRDVAAALFFAANNGALLGPDAAVHRCSEIGFEGVVDVAVAACGTHFGVGHDVLIDLHWLSARDATFVVDAALDELEATVNRRKASLKFIAGRGRHSVGAPKLGAAVRACLEKRPRLKAAEVRPGVFDVRVRAASP
ncbi:hypothetical protein JL721_1566 [Aureococcus anophagefferens]|nr:hypothetical protein JL721_1566 [Aureococcus anophagefferens]